MAAQHPFAVVLGCSDSRAPVELIFDQCLGDLFVIRVAGNIVAPSQIGSVEFAAERFGTPLVVVLGHSRCGAVQATPEGLRPSIASARRWRLMATDLVKDADGSAILEALVQRGPLLLAGAEYSLETGVVDFFEGDTES